MKRIIKILICCIFITSLYTPAIAQAYTGTPYGGTAPVATGNDTLQIEFENFDNGGQNVAYYSVNTSKATTYRTSEYISIVKIGGKSINLKNTEWVNYTVNAEEDGIFAVKFNALAQKDGACIDIYVNGEKQIENKKMTVISGTSTYTPSLNDIGMIRLEKGTNVIKIQNPNESFYLDYFTLEPSSVGDIYVDPTNGADENDGTEEKPFKTIDAAKELATSVAPILKTDLHIYIKAGTYTLSEPIELTTKNSGKGGYIIYDVYGGDKVTFGGGYAVSGWTFDENAGLYKAAVPSGIKGREMFVNGVRAVRARSESAPSGVEWDDDGFTVNETFLAEFKNPSDIEFVYIRAWINNRAKAESITVEDGKAKIKMQQPNWRMLVGQYENMKYSLGSELIKPVYYENALELLDKEREFYIDKTENTVYYMPASYENMETAEVIIPQVTQLLVIKADSTGVKPKNIKFKNIEFAYTTWNYPDEIGGLVTTQDNVLNWYELTDNNMPIAAVQLENAVNISFENCKFNKLGSTGVALFKGTKNCELTGNEFGDIAGIGLCIGDSAYHKGTHLPENEEDIVENITVTNNYFHDMAVLYRSGAAVSLGFPRNVTLANNEIFNTNYAGVHVGLGWDALPDSVTSDIVIEKNYLHEIMASDLYDGGAIYTLGITKVGAENPNYVRENYIKNVYNSGGALYNDQGSANWCMESNVVDLSDVPWWKDHNSSLYQQPRWLLTNSANTGRITYKNNYTTSENALIRQNVGVFGTEYIKDGKFPVAACEIMNNSGLAPEYAALSGGVQSFELDCETVTLAVGNTRSVSVVSAKTSKDKPIDVSGKTFYFASDDESVATVDLTGKITGVKNGTANVSVSLVTDGVLRTKTVSVTVE